MLHNTDETVNCSTRTEDPDLVHLQTPAEENEMFVVLLSVHVTGYILITAVMFEV